MNAEQIAALAAEAEKRWTEAFDNKSAQAVYELHSGAMANAFDTGFDKGLTFEQWHGTDEFWDIYRASLQGLLSDGTNPHAKKAAAWFARRGVRA